MQSSKWARRWLKRLGITWWDVACIIGVSIVFTAVSALLLLFALGDPIL